MAADPDASVDEIIDAGHATDVAVSEDQMVVTWEVEPEDDEGPCKGAWRLYDRDKGEVADGTFGTVREADARIEAITVRDGFVLTDYVKHRRHLLTTSGRVAPARLAEAKLGTALAGGELVDGRATGSDEAGWSVLLPNQRAVVRLTDLPTTDVQALELTSDGTVWVLLPWTADGTFRVAHAKNGIEPWTTETLPIPKDMETSGSGVSASGATVFVAAGRGSADRTPTDVLLSRTADPKGTWQRINTAGIDDDLTTYPRITALPKGRLLALADGEGAWIQKVTGPGFTELRGPGRNDPQLWTSGRWLWSSERGADNDLHYSHNFGSAWRKFDR